MKTMGNEYFYRISGMNVPGDEVDDTLELHIDKYIDIIEQITVQLRTNHRNGIIDFFKRNLFMTIYMLKNVHALSLTREGQELFQAAEAGDFSYCHSHLPGFVSKLLTLSIEMQKEQAIGHTETAPQAELVKPEPIGDVPPELMKKILAVDDVPEVLTAIQDSLKASYKVFGVTGGEAALKFIEKQAPDLFILDIEMPEMGGIELASILRAKPEYKRTPLIFLTGNTARQYVLGAMQVGANDFLLKPTSQEELLTKVNMYLG